MAFAIQNTKTKEFWTGNSWSNTLKGHYEDIDSYRGEKIKIPFNFTYRIRLFAQMAYKSAKEEAATRGENCLIVEVK